MVSQIYSNVLTPTFPSQLNTPASPAQCHGLTCVTEPWEEGAERLTWTNMGFIVNLQKLDLQFHIDSFNRIPGGKKEGEEAEAEEKL